MPFISKYLTHSRFLFNCLLKNKVRTVRNINAFCKVVVDSNLQVRVVF